MGAHAGETMIDRRSARGVRCSLPPLLLIFVTCFVPFMRVCDHDETPLGYAMSSGGEGGLWVASRFAAAGLLAVSILFLRRRRRPGRVADVVGLVALASAFLSLGIEWNGVLQQATSEVTERWLVWSVTVTLGAVALLVRALQHADWPRWSRFVACYAVSALGLAFYMTDGGLLVGAWLYLASTLALLGIFLWTIAPGALTRAVAHVTPAAPAAGDPGGDERKAS